MSTIVGAPVRGRSASLFRVSLTAAPLAALLAFHPTAAQAHAHLKAATPAANSQAASPSDIRLTFTEAVEPSFTGIELTDSAGAAVATGPGATDPADAKIFVVPVKATLKPGTYKVQWHAVSRDTHKTNGDFTFTVRP